MAPGRRAGDGLRTVPQALAILCLAFMAGTIAHKGASDITALAERHAGAAFWPALARYLIGNIAGGSAAGAQGEKPAP
ncbi:MAG TPA: hypothetical protein VF876_08790 [Burkholderiales bacterium]